MGVFQGAEYSNTQLEMIKMRRERKHRKIIDGVIAVSERNNRFYTTQELYTLVAEEIGDYWMPKSPRGLSRILSFYQSEREVVKKEVGVRKYEWGSANVMDRKV